MIEVHICGGMQWFRTVDESGDGKIDVKELQRALAMGNLNFSLQACAQFIRCACAVLCEHADCMSEGLIGLVLARA
jgi:hypothetical protein